MISRAVFLSVLFGLFLVIVSSLVQADGSTPQIRLGTQEVGLAIGPVLPWRVKQAQSTKLFGFGAVPSWSMTLTDPVGEGWYEGQLALGVEVMGFRTDDPVTAWSVAVTPKLKYTFTAPARVRPYLEGGVGPLWTEVGGQVPEQPSSFNFIVMGGVGLSYFVSPQLAFNLGGRFYHISNGGARSTNRGPNFAFPYLGCSWHLF